MKKIFLLFLTLPFYFGCSSKMSYSDLLVKLRGEYGELTMYNYNSGGSYSEVGFFSDGSDVIIYNLLENKDSRSLLYLTLGNSATVPNSYTCLMGFDVYSTSYSEVSKFYVSNTYKDSSGIVFSQYTGDSEMKTSSQRLAASKLNLVLTVFSNFLKNTLHTSFKNIGMFPNYGN